MTCISPQKTIDDSFINGEIQSFDSNKCLAIEPNYIDLIPLGLLRRMGKVVKLGIGAGLPLLKEYPELDGIILGTANGGLGDCFKFLNQIIQYEEGTLTPTNFVQSTPNAVAGNLALMGKRTGYNSTHVNGGLSFESALLGTKMLLEENPNQHFLTGAADEFDESNYNINRLNGLYESAGSSCGEGSAMFILGPKSEKAIARLKDVDQISYPEKSDIKQKLQLFLERNDLKAADIDALVLGYNGSDELNHWYDDVAALFNSASVYTFKNLVGEYPTASAFACWMSAKLLQSGKLPEACVTSNNSKIPQRVLIYNHYRGDQHGFILMEKI